MSISTPIVTFLNQKGGVGKTSTVFHGAGALAARKLKVLIVDNDPQCNLTQGIFGAEMTAALDPATTIAAAFSGGSPVPDASVWGTGIDGVDLVPGSASMADWNAPRPDTAGVRNRRCLSEFLPAIAGRYDLVMIDCTPTLYLCSWAALIAATHVVVPLQAESYAALGLKPIRAFVRAVKAWDNPRLRHAGYLLTMFDGRTTAARDYARQLRESFGHEVFGAVVPRLVEFAEAIDARKPLSHFKPRGKGAKAMEAVATELLARVASAPVPEEAWPQPEGVS